MNFITKQRRPIAMLLSLAFCGFIFFSAMPAAARSFPADENGPAAVAADNPGSVEGPAAVPASVGKRSVVPIIIGVLAAGAVAAVLILVVFKTKYDIVGSWEVTETYPSYTWKYVYVFSGDKKSGTVKLTNTNIQGTYQVDEKNVSIILSGNFNLTGAFDSKTTMKGDIFYEQQKRGTFTATKQ